MESEQVASPADNSRERPAEVKLNGSGEPAPEPTGKTCFVIMPFRTKLDRDGKAIDFEAVFTEVIKPAVERAGLDCEKADSEPGSGLVHQKMLDSILRADVVIADITTSNANVFYELGVRHTARPSGTIMICRRGTSAPFDVNGMLYLEYVLDQADGAFKTCQDAITAAIHGTLASRRTDSLVHSLIPGLNVAIRSQPKTERKIYTATVVDTKQLGVITGDLIYVEDVDVWVNPESTRMEMARVHDDSVSATIRYHGARLGPRGDVTRDLIADELARQLGNHPTRKRHRNAIVEAATVVVTGTGELRRHNKVRKIFHVAAQHGEPSKGYVTVRSYEDCVKRVLEEVDNFNQKRRWTSWLFLHRPLRSVIFPLFGTRGRDRDSKDVATRLVQSARTYLETWPSTSVQEVYFLAYTDADFELCETAFERLRLRLELKERRKSA